MTTLAPLDHVMSIVYDVVAGEQTEGHALAELRARGYTPNPEALTDAIHLLRSRDGLIGGSVDPLVFLDAEPRIGFDSWQVAVNQCEADLAWALAYLARRPRIGVAS